MTKQMPYEFSYDFLYMIHNQHVIGIATYSVHIVKDPWTVGLVHGWGRLPALQTPEFTRGGSRPPRTAPHIWSLPSAFLFIEAPYGAL